MKVESFYFEWFKDNPKMTAYLKKVENDEIKPSDFCCDFGCDVTNSVKSPEPHSPLNSGNSCLYQNDTNHNHAS
jgi:hypothetical protein